MLVTAPKPKNAVESLRDIVQDRLVPELKADDNGRLRAKTEALRVELRLRDEKQTQAIQAPSDKIGTLMEVRQRLAVLEDRNKRN